MKIVTAAEMREIDRVTSERFGVPSLALMENAGTAAAEFVLEEYPSARRIGIINRRDLYPPSFARFVMWTPAM